MVTFGARRVSFPQNQLCFHLQGWIKAFQVPETLSSSHGQPPSRPPNVIYILKSIDIKLLFFQVQIQSEFIEAELFSFFTPSPHGLCGPTSVWPALGVTWWRCPARGGGGGARGRHSLVGLSCASPAVLVPSPVASAVLQAGRWRWGPAWVLPLHLPPAPAAFSNLKRVTYTQQNITEIQDTDTHT